MCKLYLTVFLHATDRQNGSFFLRYVVMHRLIAYFIKSVYQNVILSQNSLSQNKVKI